MMTQTLVEYVADRKNQQAHGMALQNAYTMGGGLLSMDFDGVSLSDRDKPLIETFVAVSCKGIMPHIKKIEIKDNQVHVQIAQK